MNIYEKIDLFLKAKGMSRRQLALAAGIPESTFAAAFARKTKTFPIGNLMRICDILSVDLSEFVADVDGLEIKADANVDRDEELQKDRNVRIMKVSSLVGVNDDPKIAESLLNVFRIMNKDGQKKLLEYARDIAGNEKYCKTKAELYPSECTVVQE